MKDTKIELRVTTDLKQEIALAANNEGRTVTSFVLYAVKRYLEGK